MPLRQRELQYSALGGEGWSPRATSLREEQGLVWSSFGAHSECGRLRSVLVRRPGSEVEAVADVRRAMWLAPIDADAAREQHDALVAHFRAHQVAVHYVDLDSCTSPNLFFMRDTFAMTPEGAVIARPASDVRAGEERIVAQALAQLGIPIVLSVHGTGTFEGADLMVVDDGLALVAEGLRTNAAGAAQVSHLLRESGVAEVARVRLPDGCMHLDCALSLVDRRAALVDAELLPAEATRALRRHGFELIELPPEEAGLGMAVNLVALEPGLVVTPGGFPQTRARLERAGVTCLPVEIGELMKGGGAIHCMTGVIRRDPL